MALQTFTAGQVLTASQVTALQANDYNQTVSTKTANYTLLAADKGTRLVGNGTSITFTVDNTIFSAGDTLKIHNINSTALTIAAGAGVTINAAAGLTIAQWQEAVLYATSASSFILFESTASSAQGLTLLNTTSFSGVNSVSLPANTFTSAYKNYKFVFNCVGSTFDFIRLRMRASGSDNSSNNYKWTLFSSQFANVSGNWSGTGNTTLQSSIIFTYMYNGFPTYQEGMIYNPQATEYTSLNALGVYVQDATTGGYSNHVNGALTVTTSYDSFSLIPASGTMTGSISIYGVNE